jgi:hypothetical protein
MAKFTLKLEEDYPYIVFGVSSTSSDYKLCWSLNKQLGIQLKREKGLIIKSGTGEDAEHAYFEYFSEASQLNYKLIENKRGASRVLREAEQADYLFILDDHPAVDVEAILLEIKKIRAVLLAFELDLEKLKHKQNLLLTA